jgi:hypothetical protein
MRHHNRFAPVQRQVIETSSSRLVSILHSLANAYRIDAFVRDADCGLKHFECFCSRRQWHSLKARAMRSYLIEKGAIEDPVLRRVRESERDRRVQELKRKYQTLYVPSRKRRSH